MSRIDQHRGRPRHETGTKQARKGYEKGMVWARFFSPSRCTTPAPTIACAAGKNIVFRDVTDLPNEPTPRALRSILPSASSALLRSIYPLRIAKRTHPVQRDAHVTPVR